MIDALKLTAGAKVEADKDVLGGNRVLASCVAPIKIEHMYLDKTKSGALMVYGSFLPEGGRSIRFSECVASAKSGALKTTYTDREGNEQPLPGYSKVVHLFQAAGVEINDLSEMEVEKKTLKLYDWEAKKEMPVEKNVLVQVTNPAAPTILMAGIREVKETKMEKDENGKYTIPTAEERHFNEVTKFFTAEGFTIEEVKTGATEPEFKNQWEEAYKGKLLDRRAKDAPKAGAPKLGGAAPAAAAGGDLDFD